MSELNPQGPVVKIGERSIGYGFRTYVVAEISANHCCDFVTASRTVVAAKEAGVHAVKVQAYTPDTMTLKSDKVEFRAGGIWSGAPLHDLYAEAALPWDWIPRLADIAKGAGVDFFSTVYDESSVEFMEKNCNPKVYKIASFELNDIPLLRCVAKTGKPVILSTGMSTVKEIETAIRTLYQNGAGGVILLKCTSEYPANPKNMNISTMCDMARRFDLPVGLSDHTNGICSGITAAALQACMIEKHFKLEGTNSPDASFSISPVEMAALTKAVVIAQDSVGRVMYNDPSEEEMRKYRRSIFVVRPVRLGHRFTKEDVKVLRPAIGLEPCMYDAVMDSVAAVDISADSPLTQDMVSPVKLPKVTKAPKVPKVPKAKSHHKAKPSKAKRARSVKKPNGLKKKVSRKARQKK